jgi:[acyl-carrier-protein] S-malonyltransferase
MMNKTALIFAGQGAQVVGMGKDWAEKHPSAARLFEQANRILGYDLASICFSGPETELTKTEHAQPGIFLAGWIAFSLLKEQVPNLTFDATAGLSLGEFTALSAAGALTFEEGLKLVRQRGLFMQEACQASQGGMAALIGMSEEAVRSVCAEADVDLANLNCPDQIVISGAADKISKACEIAKAKGAKRALPLPVAGAYHSRLMIPARDRFSSVLTAVSFTAPAVPVVANVTARPHGESGGIRDSLAAQVTGSVRWEASMRYLLAQGFTRFIELGPGKALSGFMKRIDPKVQMLNIADVPSLESAVSMLNTQS